MNSTLCSVSLRFPTPVVCGGGGGGVVAALGLSLLWVVGERRGGWRVFNALKL